MKSWLTAALLLATSTGAQYHGVSRLADFSKHQKAELLIYANNSNGMQVLAAGSALAVNRDFNLAPSGTCCSHRATPSLSHHNRRLAYVHLASKTPRLEEVGIYDLQSHVKEIFEAEQIWSVSWSPDDAMLAVIAQRVGDSADQLYVVNTNSGDFTQLSHERLIADDGEYMVSNYAAASWSPDGRRLAVEVRRQGLRAHSSAMGAIILWDLQSGQFHKLTDGVAPSWKPQEDVIAFFAPSLDACFTIKADGSDKRLLFSSHKSAFQGHPAPLFYPVVWSADGKRLIFHEWIDADIRVGIYVFDLAAGKSKLLEHSELQIVDWRSVQ